MLKGIDKIKRIVIAGAGTMGYSMGQIFAEHGYDVILYDITEEILEKAKRLVHLNQEIEVAKGWISHRQSQEVLERIAYTTDISCFEKADFVVEAIVENLEIKHRFWSEVSAIVSEEVVLCSNTSGLSITKIAEKVHHPQRFLGMHWINPPHIIPLIEIIEGEKTEDAAAQLVYDMALRIEKKPVIVKDAPGFVLNRIQFAIMRECLHIEREGIADIQGIDDIMKYGLGLRYACLGPFEVADFGGLDIFHHIASYLFADLCDEKEDFGTLKERFEQGAFGIKSQRGFYDYPKEQAEEAIRRRNILFEKAARILRDDE